MFKKNRLEFRFNLSFGHLVFFCMLGIKEVNRLKVGLLRSGISENKRLVPLKSSHRLRMCTVHLLCLDHQVELWEEWPWTLPSLSSREIHFINTYSTILRVISAGSFSLLVVNLRQTVTLHSYSEMAQRLWFKVHTPWESGIRKHQDVSYLEEA